MAKNKQKNGRRLILLLVLMLLAGALYLTYNLPTEWHYAFHRRSLGLFAIVITGASIAFATMMFQTLVNNRILTPNILGLDYLYLLLQTAMIFAFGSQFLLEINSVLLFFLCCGLMLLFALLLYQFLFRGEQRNLFFLLLVGVICGTFFQSLTTFMEVLIDPNEFQISQDIGFASFNRMNTHILWWALGILLASMLYALRFLSYLDVLALGRDQAINLGVPYQQVSKQILILVAILISVATALVGPLTFLGLLVMNLSIEFMRSHQHRWLIPASIFIAISSLLIGQILVSHVFSFKTNLSIILNFVGGSYFLYLLLRSNQKWQ